MKLVSPYSPAQIQEILGEQVDQRPSLWRCVLTLNAHYYAGTSPVCGKAGNGEFELRNRKAPLGSLRVKGKFTAGSIGSEIEISFSKPVFPDLIGIFINRYRQDQRVIIDFLNEWLKTNDTVEDIDDQPIK